MADKQVDIAILIAGCKTGDRKAQQMLYSHCYEYAIRIAMSYARDEMDTADILSHAFVKVFKSIKNVDSTKGSFYSWLKRIIINEGLDHIKSRKQFISEEVINEANEAVSNIALNNMEAKDIMLYVQKLPPATHAVFILYVVEGFAHKEIAEQLGISEGTSKWHLSEARKILQKKLDRW
jgi:RNA polymerase sigma factor (sigma-70 family)